MNSTKRRIDDPLWKAIIEQTFTHFLTFFFANAAEVFDLARKYDYLDKEFEALFPPQGHHKGVRYVDKLVRVYLRSGEEQFILCHIEVQSSKSKEDLARRMFQYYYKIFDRYKVPIVALLILTDSKSNYHPKYYRSRFMGTDLFYRFNSYKILQQEEAALQANDNPFAVVVLTALWAIKHHDASDDNLRAIKHRLYEEMLKRKMTVAERKAIYDFLIYYVNFQESTGLRDFVDELERKQGRNTIMNTKEYLLDKAKREGREDGHVEGREEGLVEGREEGRAEGRKEGREEGLVEGRMNTQKETIEKLIIGLNYSDLQILEIISCSEEFLAQIRSDLENRKS